MKSDIFKKYQNAVNMVCVFCKSTKDCNDCPVTETRKQYEKEQEVKK